MQQTGQELLSIFATEEPAPREEQLSAGKLTVGIAYGQITCVNWGRSEILRGVTYFLRDRDWGTPAGRSTTRCSQNATGFEAEVRGEVEESGIQFTYTMTIEGHADGELHIRTRGTARCAFVANRVGLTALHPLECTGRELTVRHGNGSEARTNFPILICPSQPIFDIAGLSYPLAEDETVEITFASRTPNGASQHFEMEDQRNWGDASYKTYVGSLLDPWPFEVAEGDVFDQEISVAVKPKAAQAAAIRAQSPSDQANTPQFRIPVIGTSIPLMGATEALANIRQHGAFRHGFISAYLRSDSMDDAELAAIGQVAATLGCPLSIELEVHGEPPSALREVSERLARSGVEATSILACPEPYLHSYQPDGEWPEVMPFDQFYAEVRNNFPGASIGGGMLTYFTELNRKWPPAEPIDYVGHGYCPIVHAADDRTVVQNIETLSYITRTVAERMPGVPYEIVSARLSMRQNPYGAAPKKNPDRKRIAMAEADPREKGQFGALWMLEVAGMLARSHARRLCLGALSGAASIFSADSPGGLLPSYYALEALCGLQGADEQTFMAKRQDLVDHRLALADAVFREIRR